MGLDVCVEFGSISELRMELPRLLGLVSILILIVGLVPYSIELLVLMPARTLD